MSRVRITKAFKYAYGGVRVVEHVADTQLNADDEAAKFALSNKLGEPVQESKPAAKKTASKKKE